MDKFKISRNQDTAALLKDSAELTGRPYVFYSPDGGNCRYSFVDNQPDRRDCLVINYKIPRRGSYAGYLVFLDNKDLSEFQELSFRVKGGAGGERFGLQFNGGCGGESSEVDTARYLSREIDCSWQDISIPLSAFKGIDNWENVRSFSIQFRSANWHNSGSIYIDEIRLKRRLTAIKVEDFESWGQKNLLGGDTFTFGSSVCKIEADYGRDYGYSGSAGGCRIDYGGKIGISHVRCTSFAAWTTELEGLDATDIAGLSFFIKGVAGGERPNIYLKDSIASNICVDIEKYAPVTTSWQKIEIPLKDFKELGLDLSYLTELSFIFQGKIEPGAIFIDEIAFK